MTITSTTISGNDATSSGDGGGLRAHDGIVSLTGSTVSNNYGDDGGGIHFDGDPGSLTVNTSAITDNYADDNGGGISKRQRNSRDHRLLDRGQRLPG